MQYFCLAPPKPEVSLCSVHLVIYGVVTIIQKRQSDRIDITWGLRCRNSQRNFFSKPQRIFSQKSLLLIYIIWQYWSGLPVVTSYCNSQSKSYIRIDITYLGIRCRNSERNFFSITQSMLSQISFILIQIIQLLKKNT